MPWFQCSNCGDSIKKPKVVIHSNQCRGASFTCIDCSRVFDQHTVASHTQCVTEHEKYAQGATKPGGFAAKGFFGEGGTGGPAAASAAAAAESGPEGLEFLSRSAPWKCSVCNVNCTSKETLMGHAGGVKHKRRAKAALAARNGSGGGGAQNGGGEVATAAGGGVEKEEEGKKAGTVNGADQEEEENAGGAADEKTKEKKKKAKKAKKKGSAEEEVVKKTAKWKSLATVELKKAGGTMKAKKLLALVVRASGKDTKAVGNEKILKKLQKSKVLVFEDGSVRLKE